MPSKINSPILNLLILRILTVSLFYTAYRNIHPATLFHTIALYNLSGGFNLLTKTNIIIILFLNMLLPITKYFVIKNIFQFYLLQIIYIITSVCGTLEKNDRISTFAHIYGIILLLSHERDNLIYLILSVYLYQIVPRILSEEGVYYLYFNEKCNSDFRLSECRLEFNSKCRLECNSKNKLESMKVIKSGQNKDIKSSKYYISVLKKYNVIDSQIYSGIHWNNNLTFYLSTLILLAVTLINPISGVYTFLICILSYFTLEFIFRISKFC